jgi:uncharacterized repeat protein (TIGR01451 family)
VTISWTTQGFTTVTLNGQEVNNPNGSKTFTNVQENTTYTLIAKTADGTVGCTANITVKCVTPPVVPVAPSCDALGYDFTVAKFTWNGHIYVKNSGLSDYVVTVAGNDTQANWTSSKNIAAVIGQTSSTYKTFNGGLSGIVKKCDIGNGCEKITHIQMCGNTPPVVIPAPTCELTPVSKTINSGETVNLAWSTTNASSTTLTSFGSVALSGSENTGSITSNTTYTLSVLGKNGQSISCKSNITVRPTTTPICDLSLVKSVSTSTAKFGDELTYTIKIKNTGTADCTGGGVKIEDIHNENITFLSQTHTSNLNAGYGNSPVYTPSTKTLRWNGNVLTPGEEGTIVWTGKVNKNLACDQTVIVKNTAKATAYELNNFSNWVNSNTVETLVRSTEICNDLVPKCDGFGVYPTSIKKGESATLTWATSNVTQVAINNGIGNVSATGTLSVTPLSTTEYMLTAFGVNNQQDICKATLTVTERPVTVLPKCESFTATPTSLPVGGGSVKLVWSTINSTSTSISPTIGAVASNGSTTVVIANTQIFTLTTASPNGSDTCAVAVPVAPPVSTPITCAANVSIGVSPTSIREGDSSTLTWSTTNITGVSFDNGITATGLSGSVTISPTVSTIYNLTATDGKNTISCPVSLSVTTNNGGGGGGGGGSSSPRCELSVSKNKINRGETVTLTWDSSRASEVYLEDITADEKLVTTEGLRSRDKEQLFDGTIRVSPKVDTTYRFTVERGSRDRTCTVKVDVEDNIVVTQIRDQQPLVAGISLSQVPYTGFEAGPILTLMFYALLMAWALYMAYLLVIRKDIIGGMKLAKANSQPARFIPEEIRPDVFVARVQAPVMPVSNLFPNNLPTGTPVIGYGNSEEAEEKSVVSSNVHNINDEDMTRIENHAHAQRVLLSSDAIRHFIATTNTEEERVNALDQVIVTAKAQFPAEDGWVVLNEKRMQDVCVVCSVNQTSSSKAPYIPAIVPEGSGSLAEAIVTGNVVAAYEMIGNRPMFALADAAADLDAVYRIRRGLEASVSELLMKETATLTNEQILQMISALTGALDGTYTDEAAAVKMSIMKAIKVVA